MSLLKKLFIIFLFIFSMPIMAGENFQANIQTYFDHWRLDQQAPAASLLIVMSDNSSHSFLSGTVTKNGRIPLTADNLFGVGSITKTFVAATILQLQQEHKLNIDNEIGSYFPEYPRWAHVTIRQLLNMTSGIVNFTTSNAYKKLVQDSPDVYHPESFFVGMAYQQKDLFLPGQAWDYSNTNYYLLGMLIERLTHHSLAQEFAERFFIPLHLTHSIYSADAYPIAIYNKLAHAYLDDKDVTHINPAYFGPGGSMIMNASDLALWVRALFTPGTVLTAESLRQLMTTVAVPYTSPRPKGSAYGLGVFSVTLPYYGLVWWYSGVVDGYSSVFLWVPAKNIIVVAQVNHWALENSNYALLMPGRALIDNVLKMLEINKKPTEVGF